MKKFLALFVLLSMALPACASGRELVVFAAASLTETLTRIIAVYEAKNEGVSVVCNFDSSGTLKTQIQEGAQCDIFISAAPRQINELQGLGLLLDETRTDLLENKISLAVPSGNPSGIKSFDELASRLRAGKIFLAVGNSDVPVGQYTQKIFAFYGLDERELAQRGLLTYGGNVKEVTSQVSEAAVDCGIIYATDAYSAGLDVVDTATKDMCGRVIYPSAVLKECSDREEAVKFLEFLKGEEAGEIFKSVGFSHVR